MKPYVVQLICWCGLLAVLSACPSNDPELGAVIETAIPNGLVPGSALTLKGRDFGAVQSVKFANDSVTASEFIRTATNELTLKVPPGAQAGEVRVVSENGPGHPKQMALLTGNTGLTVDNVNTNVTGITQGYVANLCVPEFFVFCYNGACIGYYRGRNKDCDTYYSVEQITGKKYEVFRPISTTYEQVVLKFEIKGSGTGYTGLVLAQLPNGDNYVGSILKNNSVIAYSIRDGSELKLCKPDMTGFNPNGGRLCPPDRCSACQ